MAHPRRGMAKSAAWACMVAMLLIVVGVYFWFNRDKSDPKKTSMSAEQAKNLVRLADEANACLENEDLRDGFELAHSKLDEIQKTLPDSVFVARNRVIARLLFYRKNSADLQDDQEYIDQTTSLIEKLIELEGEAFEPYILAVRWRYEITNDIDQTDIELLEQAIQNAGSSPIPFFEFYDKTSILDDNDSPGIEAKQQEALAKAYDLQPNNIKLAMLYLQQLAELKDDRFETTWKEFNERLLPLVISADLEMFESSQQEYVDKVQNSVDNKNWVQILLNVRRLSNLVKRGEVQKIDLARIQPYELEFLKFRLDDEVVRKAATDTPKTDPSAIRFEQSEKIESKGKLLAVKLVDLDIDTSFEIAALSENEFAVYKLTAEGKWKTELNVKLEKNFSGFVAADLDFDKRTVNPKQKNNPDKPTVPNNYSDPDFVFFGPDGITVYENKLDAEGNRILESVEPGDLSKVANVNKATLVDIDHDKDLDLVVAGEGGMRLFLSRGNLSFYDFSKYSVMPDSEKKVASLDIVDLDRDIDIDILIGFENGKPGYLENLGHSQLRFRQFDDSLESLDKVSQIFAVEMDGQPSWDLLGKSSTSLALTTTETTQTTLKKLADSQVAEQGKILTVADFNNDGFLDCLCSGDSEAYAIAGNGQSVSDEKMKLGPMLVQADSGDLDGDGKVDVVGISKDGNAIEIWSNQLESENQWLAISVCGRDSNFPKGRINNHAIGSFVEVKIGDYYFATTVKRPQLHFGLGEHSSVDLIRTLWTSGMPQSLVGVKPGQGIYEEMFEKGSCPYIYTWDGNKFTFFSDCLWAAPLGLQYAPGKFIPCRNWEYLKIPGEILKPKDGKYVLQITEELREAAYFDLIKLYAVDHPADVDIYTNEKVGPAFIAEHKIHTVQNPRIPVAAKDRDGHDVLDLISNRDGKYFKGFKERLGKGLAPVHFLELDFGDLQKELGEKPDSKQLTLFLNGWIRPTDCSLNISYAQNPNEPSPIPPVVLVPDENGKWVKRIDPMGFPGGKPKTIAVDLTNAFLCNDYRIRIQTSHEIYWDQVFYTLGESPSELRQTECQLLTADLHYRGFSRRYTNGPDAPEVYDYQTVNTTPRWPAMTGNFTRFGDVKNLLTQKDDCSAVIGSGDEMTVSFESLADPPKGWKRDFVIHFVGYDKDGDLNTVTGQSSEPLPFDGMKSYPWSLDEEFPDTPKHREYLQKYQTRRQSWGSFWKRVVSTDSISDR